FEEIANPVWFRRDPTLAWGFYGHRANLYRRTEPHAGYALLGKWHDEQFVFTSNIDGHFARAGFDPDAIVECHGTMTFQQCFRECSGEIWLAPEEPVRVHETTLRA